MREIKFRGLRDNGKWEYGYLVLNYRGEGSADIVKEEGNGMTFCRVRPETVGQYTGIHDTKGAEIYEGDILETSGPYLFEVVFKDGTFRMLNMQYPDVDNMFGVWVHQIASVVGNIHQKEKGKEED